MAGTLVDQATLAKNDTFISSVKAAMLSRCKKIEDNITGVRETEPGKLLRQLQLSRSILANGASEAERVAWLVATMDNSIGAAAPAQPADTDLQNAVNTQMARLWA